MDKTKRFALFLFVLGLLLFLGLVFSSWTVPNIVSPAAQAVWLFLRMFILSVDQEIYWWLLTSCVTIWAFYQLSRREEPVEPERETLHNEALNNLEIWREFLTSSKNDNIQRSIIKQKLILLVTSHYAAWQQCSNPLEIHQALEQRQLPLPDSLYNFMFVPEPEEPSRLSLQTFTGACQRWYHRITGQEDAKFNQMIDELIKFMQNSSENENDYGTDRPGNYQ